MKTQITELRNMTTEELQQKTAALKKELYELMYTAVSGTIEKPHFISAKKRHIARIKTIMREKENANSKK